MRKAKRLPHTFLICAYLFVWKKKKESDHKIVLKNVGEGFDFNDFDMI